MESATNPYDPAESLARSAFGFAFFGLIPAIIVWIALALSPVSPDATFAQIRTIIIVGFGLATLLLLGLCIGLLRAAPARLLPQAHRVVDWLSRRWLIAIIIVMLVEINLLSWLLLVDVAPTITGPGKFLLGWWSVVVIGIIVTANLQALADWLNHTIRVWAGAGLISVILVLTLLIWLVNQQVIAATDLPDQFRASLDFRSIPFSGDANPDLALSRDYLIEQSNLQLRWEPYTYWVMASDSGKYINIEQDGLRRTASFLDTETDTPRIFFFGGSTVWGEGARDDHTIPSHAARLLHEAGHSTQVLNFGQTGYVSTQDLILFELQLALGNAPDVAVFYQGFNDTLSAYGHGISGLPLSEVNRARDFYTGRLLDDGHMVLRPQTNLKLDDLSLVASADGTAEGVVTRYLANVELLETLADAYDVELLFVWQPALFYKQPRSPEEETLWQANEDRRPGLIDFYQQVDRLLREQTPENMAILSDLFQDTENQVFIDPVHITEDGNLAVAQTLLPRLIEILSSNSE